MKAPSTAAVRAIIAIMVVGVFMFITAVLALYPLFTSANVETGQYADFFAKTSSVYTGIVGVIIGYYFARRTDGSTGSTDGQAKPGPNEGKNLNEQ